MAAKHHFHFDSVESPTKYNLQLCLKAAGFSNGQESGRYFSDSNIGANDTALQHLEYKHQLAQMLQAHSLPLLPVTYCINDTNASQVLDAIAEQHQDDHFIWIYKPSMLNNGEQIKIFQEVAAIKALYQTNDRLGGDFVIQQYITNPHLLDGHKYTMRMFVVLSNFKGYALYPHGYYNIGLEKYPRNNDFNHLAAHLTNEHIRDPEPNVVQMPTTMVKAFSLVLPQIEHIVAQTMSAFETTAPDYFTAKKTPAFDILGFDFLLDDTMKLWLLEINHGPCFPKEEPHVLKQHLYDGFWQWVVAEFVIPIIEE